MNFKIEAFDFDNLYYLFGEIFVKRSYFFVSQTKTPLIVDAGSNIGMSLVFFKFLYPQSKIYAFEPDPTTFKLLEKNVNQNNFPKVEPYNLALADKTSSTLKFYIDYYPGSVSMSAFPENRLKNQILVQSILLSNFIAKFKKIDQMLIDYHHNFTKNNKTLGQFLNLLDKNGYEYQLDTSSLPIYQKRTYQGVLIYAYK